MDEPSVSWRPLLYHEGVEAEVPSPTYGREVPDRRHRATAVPGIAIGRTMDARQRTTQEAGLPRGVCQAWGTVSPVKIRLMVGTAPPRLELQGVA